MILMMAALIVGSPTALASWDTTNQHELIPLYVYPNWWVSGNPWYQVCDTMNAAGGASTAIMNPNSGPGTSRNSDYDYVINRCHAASNHVIGYVDTGYGKVALNTVKANIDKYYSWYNIDGIFLDEMSNNSGTSSYYHKIYQYIKAKDATHTRVDVVGNPGAPATTDWQLNAPKGTQGADEVVVFEGPLSGGSGWGWEDYVAPAWVSTYPASSIAMLFYDVASTGISSTCSTLKANNAGLVDVTNYTVTATSTPWNNVQDPAYWSAFLAACN